MERGPISAGAAATSAAPSATTRRRRRALLLMLLVAMAVVLRPRGDRPRIADADTADAPAARPTRIVPDTVRIKVEVLNATATRGLGRLATAWLRDKGFDVVGTGTSATADRRDSTLVLDRSGHAEWARWAAAAMGGARIESRPDSLRYLDLTILVGRSWRPPPQTLYP